MTSRYAAFDTYSHQLEVLESKNRRRIIRSRVGIDFSSNDYLGLAKSDRLRNTVRVALERGVPIGSGGSRLLRGNTTEHEELETFAAQFFRCERSLFFSSGYAANFAVLSTLPQTSDLIVLDALVHASASEGARAGRAEVIRTKHNDANNVADAIRRWRSAGGRGTPWMAVESLYSMDGDRAPLEDLMAVADQNDAILYIDEAHATGVYGPEGRGFSAAYEGRENVVVLHTCSKALGGAGALVNGARVLCDFLINRCRPFIFSTAPSPLMAVVALEALYILRDEPERRARLAGLVAVAIDAAQQANVDLSSTTQILPVIVGEDHLSTKLADSLQARGFDVRAVRPPTVPEGTARLRIAITDNVESIDVVRLFDCLGQEWRSLRA